MPKSPLPLFCIFSGCAGGACTEGDPGSVSVTGLRTDAGFSIESGDAVTSDGLRVDVEMRRCGLGSGSATLSVSGSWPPFVCVASEGTASEDASFPERTEERKEASELEAVAASP
jgi:hypothetical protein